MIGHENLSAYAEDKAALYRLWLISWRVGGFYGVLSPVQTAESWLASGGFGAGPGQSGPVLGSAGGH
jgi:hypothetical protein